MCKVVLDKSWHVHRFGGVLTRVTQTINKHCMQRVYSITFPARRPKRSRLAQHVAQSNLKFLQLFNTINTTSGGWVSGRRIPRARARVCVCVCEIREGGGGGSYKGPVITGDSPPVTRCPQPIFPRELDRLVTLAVRASPLRRPLFHFFVDIPHLHACQKQKKVSKKKRRRILCHLKMLHAASRRAQAALFLHTHTWRNRRFKRKKIRAIHK